MEGAYSAGSDYRVRRWLNLGVVFATLLLCRSIAFKMGVPVSQRALSGALSVATVGSFYRALSLMLAAKTLVISSRLSGVVSAYGVVVALAAAYGVVRGNELSIVIKELAYFVFFITALVLGTSDRVWAWLERPLLISSYLGFVLIVFTYRVAGVQTGFGGSQVANLDEVSRNLSTVGASLRPLTGAAFLLGAIGLVRGGRVSTRVPYLGAFATVIVVNCFLFGFRGTLVSFGVLLAWYFTRFGLVRKRLVVGAVLVLGICVGLGFAYFQESHSTMVLKNRIVRTLEGDAFESRRHEARVFFEDLGIETIIGRGLGGTYTPPFAQLQVKEWRANHFGYLGYVLRGGLLLFVLNVVLPLRGISVAKSALWRRNEYNQVAFLLAPVIVLNLMLNPLTFTPDSIFATLPLAFCFGRFYREGDH